MPVAQDGGVRLCKLSLYKMLCASPRTWPTSEGMLGDLPVHFPLKSSMPGLLLAASKSDRWDSGLWPFPGSESNLGLQE